MNCPKCNTPNTPEAMFCKNCGTNLIPAQSTGITTNKSDNYTITALLVVIGVEYILSVLMFLLNKLFIPQIMNSGSSHQISLIYNTFGWVSDIITLGVILFFMVTIKNNKVKTALVVFFILRVIFMIGYKAMPLLNF